MSHVSIVELISELEAGGLRHREVLDAGPISVEVGRYPPEESTPQAPHNEEELYYFLAGSGTFRVGDDVYEVEAGDLVYVEPALEHEFLDIEEELVALTIFGPAIATTSYSALENATE